MLLRGCLIVLLLGVNVAFGQQKPDTDWLSQKFSMFIHWGLYSELGGVWKDKPVQTGYSEQIRSFAQIPANEYDAVAKEFNPEKWDAEAVVKLAKDAGMRSIVFTSKHHDGFCMYHSKYSDYNVVDATPFKRDVMKELSDACKKYGVKFAVYYSLIDWHFPGNKITPHNADAISDEHHEYSMKQVEEIMTNYGPVSEIWFDMGSLTGKQSKELYDLVTRLQPQCMVSGRLGNDRGDFAVMADNTCPDYKIGVPWQTPASFFNETWGYRSWQERGDPDKKTDEKLHDLVQVVSRGGNYLLNIGLRGDGSIVEFERDVLLEMGKWLNKYEETIYNTTASPFARPFAWGNLTRKGNNLYLFIEQMPENRTIMLEGMIGTIVDAKAMWNDRPLMALQLGHIISLQVPEEIQPERGIVVIKFELTDSFRITQLDRLLEAEALTAANAIPEYAYSCMDYYSGFKSTVSFSWYFVKEAESVTPAIVYTAGNSDDVIRLIIDGDTCDVALRGGEKVALNVDPKSVVYGNACHSFPQPDRFCGGDLEQKKQNDPGYGTWETLGGLKPGKPMRIPVGMKESVYVMQEITSNKEQDVLVELGVADGLQVAVNGKTVLLRTYVGGVPRKNEIIKIHLQKGQNQLLVKLHNCYGTDVVYMINPKVKQEEYKLHSKSMKLYPGPGQVHDCKVMQANPANKNSDMGLRDLRIEFE